MTQAHVDFWQFQARLAGRLLRWAAMSIGAGAALVLRGGRFWRGAGWQCAGWGAANAALALFGLWRSRHRSAEPAAHAPARQRRERALMRRILWINTGLDVLYVAGGAALAATRGRKDAFWRGTGWGILVQGGFLFWFDLFHALLLGRETDGGTHV